MAKSPPSAAADSPGPSNAPFMIAALACGLPAVVGAYWFFSGQGIQANPAVRIAVLICAGFAYLTAAWLFTWPFRVGALTRPLAELPGALSNVKRQLIDLDAIKKAHDQYQLKLDELGGQLKLVFQGMNDDLDRRLADLDHRQQALAHQPQFEALIGLLIEQLQRIHEELGRRLADLDKRQKAFDQMAADRRETERNMSEMRQQLDRAVADVKNWEESVVQFAQLLERTSDPASGLPSEYQRAATRMTGYFTKAFGPFGLKLVSPAEGAEVDKRVEQIEGSEPHPTVSPGRVVRCVEWGFILRDEVRKAKVIVAAEPVAAPLLPSPDPAEDVEPGEAVEPAAPKPTGGPDPIAVKQPSPVPKIHPHRIPTRRDPS